jgi:hypothetical protein
MNDSPKLARRFACPPFTFWFCRNLGTLKLFQLFRRKQHVEQTGIIAPHKPVPEN